MIWSQSDHYIHIHYDICIYSKDTGFLWFILVLRNLLANGKHSVLRYSLVTAYQDVSLLWGYPFSMAHSSI
jgi:hypothetical protein